MLSSINVTGLLIRVRLLNLQVLLPLEPVEKYVPQTSIKVEPQPRNNLVENVRFSTTLALLWSSFPISIENLRDVGVSGKGNELLVLGDVLPIIDKKRLEGVGNVKLDLVFAEELIFLHQQHIVNRHAGQLQPRSPRLTFSISISLVRFCPLAVGGAPKKSSLPALLFPPWVFCDFFESGVAFVFFD